MSKTTIKVSGASAGAKRCHHTHRGRWMPSVSQGRVCLRSTMYLQARNNAGILNEKRKAGQADPTSHRRQPCSSVCKLTWCATTGLPRAWSTPSNPELTAVRDSMRVLKGWSSDYRTSGIISGHDTANRVKRTGPVASLGGLSDMGFGTAKFHFALRGRR
jgi:hypothetical protein